MTNRARFPDDDWLARSFKGRNKDETERIKKALETAFPRYKKVEIYVRNYASSFRRHTRRLCRAQQIA